MNGSKNYGTFTQWNTMQQRKRRAPTLWTAQMDLESITLSKPCGERQIPYDLTYKWNLINKKNQSNKI